MKLKKLVGRQTCAGDNQSHLLNQDAGQFVFMVHHPWISIHAPLAARLSWCWLAWGPSIADSRSVLNVKVICQGKYLWGEMRVREEGVLIFRKVRGEFGQKDSAVWGYENILNGWYWLLEANSKDVLERKPTFPQSRSAWVFLPHWVLAHVYLGCCRIWKQWPSSVLFFGIRHRKSTNL